MKIFAPLVGVLLSSAAAAADGPALAFPPVKNQVPALSLLETAKPPIAVAPTELWTAWRVTPAPAVVRPKAISRMPILVPGPATPRMLVKVPDDTIDYKLLIKKPELESVR